MSLAKRLLEEREQENEMKDRFEWLAGLHEQERLSDEAQTAVGKVLASGNYNTFDTLPPEVVNEVLEYTECGRCASGIPASELVDSLESGYCSYCDYMMNKDD